jgi:hypothetical protein
MKGNITYLLKRKYLSPVERVLCLVMSQSMHI